jgi:hypothetical protein
MPGPWSSQLAGDLRRERERLLFAFLELRAALRNTDDAAFPGGAAERALLLGETETDYVSLVTTSAEAVRLEASLESADREATDRELDIATLLIEQLQELVVALARRLP